MINRSPSPRGGVWIVDPIERAGIGWPATDARPIAAVPGLTRIVADEMPARSAADAVAGVR